MDIRYKYKQILENLYVSKEGLQLYTINRRFNITPSRLIEFINRFSTSGIIAVEDGSTVLLTDNGRRNFHKIIPELYKDWSFCNESYLQERLFKPTEKYSPYIPSDIIRLDKPQQISEESLFYDKIPF